MRNTQKDRRLQFLLFIGLVLWSATFVGCRTTEPHIVAKVIVNQNGNVSGEVSSEWR